MATFVFELIGGTALNMEAVRNAIASIPGVTSSKITASLRGATVLFIDFEGDIDSLLALLNAVLKSLGVHAQTRSQDATDEDELDGQEGGSGSKLKR
ncbi:hypothetical protein [Stenotrophomonas sp.]|uniref:hypothetical protein n=1 Tax=Stenotrophomonas sp. TaxID=69392 RepID=UPI0028A852F2|nr:hypothetical protein [Stenotrophomonas sp.]